MRIDKIHIQNFRGIEDLEMEFDKQFTLLVGENGSGKTSILSALAVAVSVLSTNRTLGRVSGWRKIMPYDARESWRAEGDRGGYWEAEKVSVSASGSISETLCEWTYQGFPPGTLRDDELSENDRFRVVTTYWSFTDNVVEVLTALRKKKEQPLPLVAYYGAGRAWVATNEALPPANLNGDLKDRVENGYIGCMDERISIENLRKWFVLEAAARDEHGKYRKGFDSVCIAIANMLRIVSSNGSVGYDLKRSEIYIKLGKKTIPFSHMSDGQRTMVAMVADMAQRAVTLNSYLLTEDANPEVVLQETPGVVLIDELDVHLHPKWQRSVVADLKRTFPKIQFICSSHSPQIFGEVPPHQILLHDAESNRWFHPGTSEGLDSNRVLEEKMGALSRNVKTEMELSRVARAIDDENFEEAETLLKPIIEKLGENDAEVTRARALMSFLKD